MFYKINAMNLSSFNQEIGLLVQLEINSVVSQKYLHITNDIKLLFYKRY
jgi:hypothetical protein